MRENVIVRPCKGDEFPAVVLGRRDTSVGPEVLIEYLSVLGQNTAWISAGQVRPAVRHCADTRATDG